MLGYGWVMAGHYWVTAGRMLGHCGVDDGWVNKCWVNGLMLGLRIG